MHCVKLSLASSTGTAGVFPSDGAFTIEDIKQVGGTQDEKWEDKGIITIPGMQDKGSMKDSPQLEEVYKFGKSL